MAIDPVEGIVMGAVQAAANAKANADYDKKLREAMERHAETVAIGSENLHNQAILRTGGQESLGWMYSGSVGSVKMYFTKEEYLKTFIQRNGSIVTDADLAGWNPAWGGPKTEIAMARREHYARMHPERAQAIRNAPLDTYAIEVRHLENYAERLERERLHREKVEREAREHNRFLFLCFLLGGIIWLLGYWYFNW